MTATPLSGNLPLREAHITRDDQLLEHAVKDEELDQLAMNRDDYLTQIYWGSLGMAGGAFIPFMSGVSKLAASTPEFGFTAFAECIVFALASGAAIVAYYLSKKRNKNTVDIIQKIRDRPKVRIHEAEQSEA